MTLKQILFKETTLFVDDIVDINNLVEDTIIIYGHNNRDKVLGDYANHYGLSRYQVDENMKNIKQYRDSGDIVRNVFKL